jgi:hypothetical protein
VCSLQGYVASTLRTVTLVFELLSDPHAHIRKNVNTMEIVECGNLERALKRAGFGLMDEKNENLNHVD